jgi:hypothetical protein
MRGAFLLIGAVICLVAVHPSYGRGEDNGNDYVETRPSAAASAEPSAASAPANETQDSDSQLTLPMVAKGSIHGLIGGGDSPLTLDIHVNGVPGSLNLGGSVIGGELDIEREGFEQGDVKGVVRLNRLQFQVSYGSMTYFFEGKLQGNQISGDFQTAHSEARGSWTAQVE